MYIVKSFYYLRQYDIYNTKQIIEFRFWIIHTFQAQLALQYRRRLWTHICSSTIITLVLWLKYCLA